MLQNTDVAAKLAAEIEIVCVPVTDRQLASQASTAHVITYMSGGDAASHRALMALRTELTTLNKLFQASGNQRLDTRHLVQIATRCAGILSQMGLAVFAGTGAISVDGEELNVLIVYCASPEADSIAVTLPTAWILSSIQATHQQAETKLSAHPLG